MDRGEIEDGLRARGIEIEERDPTPIENLVGSGVGSLAGQLVARLLKCGWLGTGLGGVAGGALGLLAAKYRVRWVPSEAPTDEAGPDEARPGAYEGQPI